MIVRDLPSPAAPINWDAPCPVHRWPNMVVNARASGVYFPEHEGTLSVKCVFRGREHYRVGTQHFPVDTTSYLVLNAGQRYESWIEHGEVAESFCVFFRPLFAETVLYGLVTPADVLADNPEPHRHSAIQFVERLYPHDSALSPLLAEVRRSIQHNSFDNSEELFHRCLEHMLAVQRDIGQLLANLPAVRLSTRLELHRRLSCAREYMDACFATRITLADIAGAACLSTHHFLRLFRQMYGLTPNRYLAKKRLNKACELLTETDIPVTSVCFAVGFESPSTFSRFFRAAFGVSPERFRAAARGMSSVCTS